MTTHKKCEAVLFDFDMTLADSSDAIHHCTNLLAKEFGLREISHAEVKAAIGVPIEDSWYGFWGDFKQEWLNHYRAHFRDDEIARIKLFPSAFPTVKALKVKGKKLGVASNRRFAFRAVGETGLASLLDVIIGLEDVERAKPEPDCLIKGFEKLEVELENGIYVGDTDIDMKTATAAGIRGIGVTTGNFGAAELMAAGASLVLDELSRLSVIIDEL